MASPFPFTSGQVLTAAQLNSIGAYTDFSGSVSFPNFTLGNGTIDYCVYTEVNDLVHYTGLVTLGSTSAMSGRLDVTLPINADIGAFSHNGVGECWDGTNHYYSFIVLGSATYLIIQPCRTDLTYLRNVDVSATVPFVWGTSDKFGWNLVYKAA